MVIFADNLDQHFIWNPLRNVKKNSSEKIVEKFQKFREILFEKNSVKIFFGYNQLKKIFAYF